MKIRTSLAAAAAPAALAAVLLAGNNPTICELGEEAVR
jgi:hypothetical protein